MEIELLKAMTGTSKSIGKLNGKNRLSLVLRANIVELLLNTDMVLKGIKRADVYKLKEEIIEIRYRKAKLLVQSEVTMLNSKLLILIESSKYSLFSSTS